MIEGAVPKLSELMKIVAAGVINSMQLPEVYLGTVVKVNPLEIMLTQQNRLPEKFLILTNAVKDHEVDITVSWATVEDNYLKPAHTHGNGNNGSPTASTSDFDTKHKHDIKGRKKITVHNGLTVGEKVLLLRVQGGQNYVVVDRISKLQTSGECL